MFPDQENEDNFSLVGKGRTALRAAPLKDWGLLCTESLGSDRPLCAQHSLGLLHLVCKTRGMRGSDASLKLVCLLCQEEATV